MFTVSDLLQIPTTGSNSEIEPPAVDGPEAPLLDGKLLGLGPYLCPDHQRVTQMMEKVENVLMMEKME